MNGSYFDCLPLEIVSIILSSGKSLFLFSQAYPDLREDVIQDFIRISNVMLYKICENIINDLEISWYTVTYYMLSKLKIISDENATTLDQLRRVAIGDFLIYEGIIGIDEHINYGDTNNEYYISASIVSLHTDKYKVYEYIKDHNLYVRYGLNIFSWIYINILQSSIKNIVLSPDLDCNVMKDIIKLIDKDF